MLSWVVRPKGAACALELPLSAADSAVRCLVEQGENAAPPLRRKEGQPRGLFLLFLPYHERTSPLRISLCDKSPEARESEAE